MGAVLNLRVGKLFSPRRSMITNRRISMSSKQVRRKFLDFFVNENRHEFVKSSPVVPYCDETVPFVNAGMNQFKGVLLGKTAPISPRIANSQKCVRAGGKHNDLDVVGTDGRHHTFFEMLGNWSFGDYYKRRACEMALKLLTEGYGLDRRLLKVSYFGGDDRLGLTDDFECREVWKSLGIADEALIAMGSSDNFWEMGDSGPCGPCTEIHYTNPDGSLTEIWNIVFITHKRDEDGNLSKLLQHNVDTGMGLERLTALLQNKRSNYDTDLFMPIIKAIHLKSRGGLRPYEGQFGTNTTLDKSYRTLADFSRMISVCIADGMYPSVNVRLRSVLRKAFALSIDVFKCPNGMLQELHNYNAEILGETYPELIKHSQQIKEIINHEEQSYLSLRKSNRKHWSKLVGEFPELARLENADMPGIFEGYRYLRREMKDASDGIVPGRVAFRLYDGHGLKRDVIQTIANINNLKVDMASFEDHLLVHKNRAKAAFSDPGGFNCRTKITDHLVIMQRNGVKRTDDSHKYDYKLIDSDYEFPEIKTKVVNIFNETGEAALSEDIDFNISYHLICEDTNFFCEEGGQSSDCGEIIVNGLQFKVKSVSKFHGFVIHSGQFIRVNRDGRVRVDDDAILRISADKRLAAMRNHTAVHLLNASLKLFLPASVICQVGSKVSSDGLSLSVAVYGERLSPEIIKKIQSHVDGICSRDVPVRTTVIDAQQLLRHDDVTTVPGEIYPNENLRLVEIDAPLRESKEPCCGTHVRLTSSIGSFCIVGVRGASSHTPTIKAVTGRAAAEIFNLIDRSEKLLKEIKQSDFNAEELSKNVHFIKQKLNEICLGDKLLFGARSQCVQNLDSIEKIVLKKNKIPSQVSL